MSSTSNNNVNEAEMTQLDQLREDLEHICNKVECRYQVATRANELERVNNLIQDYKDEIDDNIGLIQSKYTHEGKHRKFEEVEKFREEMDNEFQKMFEKVEDDLKRLNQN